MFETDVETLVVGAGIGGLAVARDLVAAGRSVAVLEARDRIGGRLLSTNGLDLGATWYWPSEPRIARLISELGVAVHSQYLGGDAVYHDPNGAQRLDGNPVDVESGRFVRGADALPRAVARDLPDGAVRLGVVVSSVRRMNDHNLVVGTSADEITAKHVVLALPPALAVDTIDVSPPLPERLASLARTTPVWMGAITKVVIQYSDAFWRRNGLSGSAISHVGPMREVHDMSGVDAVPAALFGFVPAQTVGEPTVTRDAVVAQLVAMFGPDAATPESVEIKDWRHERFTSPLGVEQLTAYQTFGHDLYSTPALGGRLHWSSTETSRQFPGHIEGALEAAERVVDAIVASPLRPAPAAGSAASFDESSNR